MQIVLGDKATRKSLRRAGSSVEHPEIDISKRLVAVNSLSSVLSKFVNMTVILWSYQYLLRRIPADEFAVLPVVTSLMVFAPLFFSFFTGGMSRYIVEAYARQDFEGITRITSSMFVPLSAISVVFLGIGLVFAARIDDLLNVAPNMASDAQLMMVLLVCSFTLQMLSTPFTFGFNVRQRFVYFNMLGIARDFLRVILLFGLLLGAGPRVLWVVVATTAAQTLHTLVVAVSSCQMLPELRFRIGLVDRRQMGRLLGFGFWTTLGRLGSLMYTSAATILLNLYGSAVDVTSYYIGATFFRQIDDTINLAAHPTQTVLTTMHTNGERERLARTVFRGGRYAMWAALFVAAPLTIFANDFILLYLGPEFSEASMVIVLFMLIFPFTSPTALVVVLAMAKAEVRGFFLMAFIFQLIGLVSMIVVINQTSLGAVGMAASLCGITIASQLSYYWGLGLRLTGQPWQQFLSQVLVPGLKPALAATVFWMFADWAADQNTWLSLAVWVGIGSCIYVAVLLLAGLNRDERSDAIGLLRAVAGRSRATQTPIVQHK